jgi:hypothetical protein
MEPITHGAWYALLSPREQATVDHALSYAAHFSHAGVPGHSAHLLIAKLASELDKATVGVTAAIAPTTSINDAMSAIEDIAELVGWPCFDSNQAEDNFSMQFKLGGL